MAMTSLHYDPPSLTEKSNLSYSPVVGSIFPSVQIMAALDSAMFAFSSYSELLLSMMIAFQSDFFPL